MKCRKLTQSDLRELTGLCRGTMSSIWHDKSVTLDTIEKICVVLGCAIDDVVKIVHEPGGEEKVKETEVKVIKTKKEIILENFETIQKCRYSFTALENKVLLYVISKIQSENSNTYYEFSCKEFRSLMGWDENSPYTKFKSAFARIFRQHFTISLSNTAEAIVWWFNTVRMDKGREVIRVTFHEDMLPYLVNIKNSHLLSPDVLKGIIRMRGKYSSRIYEALEKNQKNNNTLEFEVGTGSEFDIQKIIADTEIDSETGKAITKIPDYWNRWTSFRKDVLDKAVEEINTLTDINVLYTANKYRMDGTPTHSYSSVSFTIRKKMLMPETHD